MNYDEDTNKSYMDNDEGLGLDIDDVESEAVDRDVYTPALSEDLKSGTADISKSKSEEVIEETTIFAVKTSLGHEKTVVDSLAARIKEKNTEIYSILSPAKLRGYILLEGKYKKEFMADLLQGIQYAKGVVEGTTSMKEIEHFLTPKPLVSGIVEGDIVEIVSGPFKGEKARVQQVDETKEEITVELFEAMVSIPVTIKGDHVRVIEKEDR